MHRSARYTRGLSVAVLIGVAVGLIVHPVAAAGLGSQLVQVAKLTASDAAAGDYFGFSVAVSGETAVVGAYGNDDAGNMSGSAYVFERSQDGPDGWGEVDELTPSDGDTSGQFGWSVAIDGDALVVGSPGDDDACSPPPDSDCYSGAVYVFERDSGDPNTWNEVAKLTASDLYQQDLFGFSVAISGDTVVVGARYNDDDGADSGSAYVFERDWGGADNWGQVAKLVASDAAAGDEFGFDVAIDGDTVIVGAIGDDDGGADSGSAYVFERDEGGADSWGEVQKLVAGSAAGGDWFGHSVSVSGDNAIVGAPQRGSADAGSAYVFGRDQGGPDQWGQVAELTAADAAADDRFGIDVAIVGETAVSAALLGDGSVADSGSAYVFEYDGGSGWVQVKEVFADDGAADDQFGRSVALNESEGTVISGATLDDDDGVDSGSAYVYRPDYILWNGSVDNDWNTPANWTPGEVPSPGDDVQIPGGSTVAVGLGESGEICDITIDNGATLSLADGTASLSVRCDWTNNGTFEPNGGTVIFNGVADQAISGVNVFYDLTIDNTHASALVDASGSTLTVENLLHVQDGVFLSATDFHDVTIDAGGTLELDSDSTVSGDWTNDGTFVHNAYQITFDGSGGDQAIGGSSVTTFDDVEVTAGASVVIPTTSEPLVEGTLTNNGALKQTRAVFPSAEFLRIGDGSGGYSHYGVRLTDTSGSGLGVTTVAVLGNQYCPAAPDLGNPPILRCFDITPASQNAATLRLYYLTSELNGNDPATVNVYHQAANGNWDMEQGTYSRESDGGTYDWVEVTGVDEYSPFIAGNHGATLIDLVSFGATAGEGSVRVTWETASEIDNAGFNVHRSRSPEGGWLRLNAALIPARGGPTQGAAYSFEDGTAEPGVVYYYRLEDVDGFGLSTFHGPVEARPSVPTSVALRCLAASPAVVGVGLLLALGAGGLALLWRKRRP